MNKIILDQIFMGKNCREMSLVENHNNVKLTGIIHQESAFIQDCNSPSAGTFQAELSLCILIELTRESE